MNTNQNIIYRLIYRLIYINIKYKPLKNSYMQKEELDKKYLNWEKEFKKKVLIYVNYTLGAMGLLEGFASYQVISLLIIINYISRIWGKYSAGNI